MIQHFSDFYSVADMWPVCVEQLHVRSEHNPGHAAALDGGMTIEALPTWYAGTTFRSRLEADWAATLDSLGITWEYEPETITLPSGARYIPDFRLPELGTWIEVKGTGVPRVEKAVELGATRTCHCDGTCSCDWPGGELVLIGHAARKCTDRTHSAWRRGGHPDWSSAHGPATWLFRCTACDRAGWAARTVPLRCRACRALPTGGHAYGPGDDGLRFANADCLPAPSGRRLTAGPHPARVTAWTNWKEARP